MARALLLDLGMDASGRAAFKPLVLGNLLDLERRMVPRMRAALYAYLTDVVEATIRDTRIRERSGKLFASLRDGIRVYGTRFDDIRAQVYSVNYGSLMEFGGIVGPKNAEYLAIPLADALRPDGTPKLLSPRSWKFKGTFVLKTKSGQLYLVYRNKADNSLVWLYVLVRETEIPSSYLRLEDHYESMKVQLYAAWGEIMEEEFANTDWYNAGTRAGIKPV